MGYLKLLQYILKWFIPCIFVSSSLFNQKFTEFSTHNHNVAITIRFGEHAISLLA